MKLTKYTNKTGTKTDIKESDHRTLIAEVSLKWNPKLIEKEPRVEVFNFKNGDDFEKFVKKTDEKVLMMLLKI